MKNKKKQGKCLNCGLAFNNNMPNEHCPSCGQENTDMKLTAWELTKELISSMFNFDSRLAHSIWPFLAKPGALSRAFMDGRRAYYVHPVRFYLFVSIFFFYAFSQRFPVEKLQIFDNNKEQNRSLYAPHEIDSLFAKTGRFVNQAAMASMITPEQANKIIEGFDTLNTIRISQYEEEDLKNRGRDAEIEINIWGDEETTVKYHKIDLWMRDPKMTPEALLDSMKIGENRTWMHYRAARQLLKYGRSADTSSISRKILDNIPIMMFILMPIFALLLKLLYIRSGRYYIEHLIVTVHLHTYIFFIFGLMMLVGNNGEWQESILTALSLMMPVYLFMAFKNYYAQGWFKTAVKSGILFFIYPLLLSFAIMLEVIISLLTY